MKIKSVYLWGLIIIFLNNLPAADVNKIIKNVQNNYDKMSNLTATFKQVEFFRLTGTQTETTGKIYIYEGTMYRFESEDQTVVTDGKTVWTYNAMSNQLLIDHVRENSGALLPRDLLFKYPKNYLATLLAEEKIGGKTIYILRLDPRENVHGYIKNIKLWVEDKTWLIHKIETTDLNDNRSLFEIENQDSKTKLSPQLFSFKAGDDVEVVDMR